MKWPSLIMKIFWVLTKQNVAVEMFSKHSWNSNFTDLAITWNITEIKVPMIYIYMCDILYEQSIPCVQVDCILGMLVFSIIWLSEVQFHHTSMQKCINIIENNSFIPSNFYFCFLSIIFSWLIKLVFLINRTFITSTFIFLFLQN